MRVFLAAAAMLLAGSLVLILIRSESQPELRSLAAPGQEVAAPGTLPALERSALPTDAELMPAALAKVKHTSLRVVVIGLNALIDEPCQIEVVSFLSGGQRASSERAVDASEECWFEKIPVGGARLTLRTCPRSGSTQRMVCHQVLNIPADPPMVHFVDLREQIVRVDLQCVNPPSGGLQSVELSLDGEILAEWDRDDPNAGVIPPTMQAWAEVNEELQACYRTMKEEFIVKRSFSTAGRQAWAVRLPYAELLAVLRPSDGVTKFILQSDPIEPRKHYFTTSLGDTGRASFVWLEPGRYHLRAGTMVRGKFIERARSFVAIDTDPVEVNLTAAEAGSVRWTLPAPPPAQSSASCPRPKRDGVTSATLLPVGASWPVFGSRAIADASDRVFEGMLAGDYELRITDGDWISRTPVTVRPDEELLVQAAEWVHFTRLQLVVATQSAVSSNCSGTLTGADGCVTTLSMASDFQWQERKTWRFDARAAPGPARLVVLTGDGLRGEFDVVVGGGEEEVHRFQLKE